MHQQSQTSWSVATALTVYGIETELNGGFGASVVSMLSCNSTYRLRY